MRLLTERRDDLVAEHTRWINRLHVLLRDLHPGGAEVRLDTTDASSLLVVAVPPLSGWLCTLRGSRTGRPCDARRVRRLTPAYRSTTGRARASRSA
jgi:hypothetical protein